MSEKDEKIATKKSKLGFLKWSFLILLVCGLEAGAIFASVYVVESRKKDIPDTLAKINNEITYTKKRLDDIETNFPTVANNTQNIIGLSRSLNLLSENLDALTNEVGNGKIAQIYKDINNVNHSIEAIEERNNDERLILAVALIIKENAMYHKNFVKEADVLSILAENQESIRGEISIVSSFKEKFIEDDYTVAEKYKVAMENFVFNKQPAGEQPKELTKSEKILKNVIDNINLDKLVVMKKEKRTEKQKELINTLNKLVEEHKFSEALQYISENEDFKKADNKELNNWVDIVKEKRLFEEALSTIIANQLSATRQDINTYEKANSNDNNNNNENITIDEVVIVETPTETEINDKENNNE